MLPGDSPDDDDDEDFVGQAYFDDNLNSCSYNKAQQQSFSEILFNFNMQH